MAVHRLEAPLRYETSDGESFPHLYGALNPDAVVAVVPFVEEADGFAVPAGVPGLGL